MTLKYTQIIVLSAILLLQYVVEHVYPQHRALNNWRNERFNISIGFLNVVLALVPAALLVRWVHWVGTLRLGVFLSLNFPHWLQVGGAVLALDLWMYVWHRLNHEVPLLWRFHAFHHRDKQMNSTTALRFHFLELLLAYPGKALVCLLFGIQYLPLLVYEILFFISVVVHHSNMRISQKRDNVYRRLFVSPGMHRIHHSVNVTERNANYGALFSFWDRLFRTSVNKASGPVVFGVED